MIGSTMGYHSWKFPCPVIRDYGLRVLLEIIGQSIADSLLVIYIQSAKTLCWAMVAISYTAIRGCFILQSRTHSENFSAETQNHARLIIEYSLIDMSKSPFT